MVAKKEPKQDDKDDEKIINENEECRTNMEESTSSPEKMSQFDGKSEGKSDENTDAVHEGQKSLD